MTKPTIEDCVLLIAAISSIIQSILWIMLSLSGLLAYTCNIPAISVKKDALANIIQHMYFRETECEPIINPNSLPPIKDLTTSQDIYIWMYLYLFVSFIWLIASILLLLSRRRIKNTKKIIVIVWLIVNSSVCIMDFILTIFFGLDYGRIHDIQILNETYAGKPLAMQTAAGIMMAMSMRGFILWILNVGFTIYIAISLRTPKPNEIPKKHMQGNTWLYDNVSIHEDEYGERKPKGLPKIEPTFGGWAPLSELLRRYKMHTPKNRTKFQASKSNGKSNESYLPEEPIQFINPSIPKTSMYDASRY